MKTDRETLERLWEFYLKRKIDDSREICVQTDFAIEQTVELRPPANSVTQMGFLAFVRGYKIGLMEGKNGK
ncbi:MAG: hypothetical protein LBL58_10195 [Tannerellaceae bacterium]|jgi:hypothetical protein|nr:hypothetical protein [Tannerellaceae bacterium]